MARSSETFREYSTHSTFVRVLKRAFKCHNLNKIFLYTVVHRPSKIFPAVMKGICRLTLGRTRGVNATPTPTPTPTSTPTPPFILWGARENLHFHKLT